MPVESVPEPVRRAHLYLAALDDEAVFKKRKEEHRDYLKAWIMEAFDPTDKGDFLFEFPQGSINLPGGPCKGLLVQRRVSEWVDDDKALAIIGRHGLQGRCIKEVKSYHIDYDELYACNQEGLISDDEIDSILEISESFALTKVKG